METENMVETAETAENDAILDNVKVATYYSENADPAWLGFVVLPKGDQWGVRFSAATEAEVIEKALKVYKSEVEKGIRLGITHAPDGVPATSKPKGDGDGRSALTGSVWVLNRTTGHRARVPADQWADYEAKGYIKAGPRTK